jgi:phenylalanyl-tRNA synthetase beta chain
MARGYTEVYNYSFLSNQLARKFGFNAEQAITVLNPIAAGQELLRPSLVPGIWKNIEENSKYFEDFRLFEIGREIHKTAGEPVEENHVAACVFHRDGTSAFYELKGTALTIEPRLSFRPCEAKPYEHPARAAEIRMAGDVVGRLFEFHPNMVEQGRACVFNLNLDALERAAAAQSDRKYSPIRRFPSSSFDLSVLAKIRDAAGDIGGALRASADRELDTIEYVREYSGPPLGEGQKSVSYRVTVSAPDRTLSSDEVSAIRSRMIEGMRGRGYELRV